MSDSQLETIGKYELLSRLATGGMAEIYLARERGLAGLQRLVVIKRILPHLATERDFVDMFLREARIIARLQHPNIVQIYELGEANNDYFIAMEYIHGLTVRELQILAVRQRRAFPVDVTVGIIAAGCRGAHAAHELQDPEGKPLGLVHRDISPHNLMVTEEGYIKLLDFGVAKAAEGRESTQSGNLKGKYAYMSPEQALHEPLDRRSDVFALGICMWEMLGGRRLFARHSEIEILTAITQTVAPPIRTVNPSVPPAVESVLAKALASDRNERWESAEAFRLALVDASRRNQIALDPDVVGDFVKGLAQKELGERKTIVDKAKESSLSSFDAKRLTRVTNSSSNPFEAATVNEGASQPSQPSQPSGVERLTLGSEKSASVTASIVMSDDVKSRASLLILVALVAAAVAAVAVVLMLHETDTTAGDPITGKTEEAADESSESKPAEKDPKDAVAKIEPEPEFDGPPIIILWAPTVDIDVLKKDIEPLRAYIRDTLERPVEFRYSNSYRDLSDQVLNGEVPYGFFPPLLFVRGMAASDQLKPVAAKEFHGSTTSVGYLLVNGQMKLTELEDLRGKTFCFPDRDSTSGYFLPRMYLKRKGHEPSEFIGSIRWSGDHLQVMRDLADGKCEAGATYSGNYSTAGSYGVEVSKLEILANTGRIPQDVLAGGPAASTEDIEKLREVLLNFDPKLHAGIDYLGEGQKISGFNAFDASAFSELKDAVTSENDAP